MSQGIDHITVCVCTYQRPRQLGALLKGLTEQDAGGLFGLSLSIVDNDESLSGRAVVERAQDEGGLEVRYNACSEKNLAKLRNISLENATGDFVAFIDDDEYPPPQWLLNHYRAIRQHGVAGALGPVLPAYLADPPPWLIKGRFCERIRLKTGTVLDWRQTRTGNALLKRNVFADPGNRFDEKYRLGAEDDALFRKLMSQGHTFIWCDEAPVFEDVPLERMEPSYFRRRARLIGYMSYAYYKDERSRLANLLDALKSLLSLLAYTPLLPVSLLVGYHAYVKVRQKMSFHYALVLTSIGKLRLERRDI